MIIKQLSKKYFSGGSARSLARYEKEQAQLEKSTKTAQAVGETALGFIPGVGQALTVASMLGNTVGGMVQGDGSDATRNAIAMAVNPLGQIGGLYTGLTKGDWSQLNPVLKAKKVEEMKQRKNAAMLESFEEQGKGLQAQVDQQQYIASLAKKGLKLKKQAGGLLTNIGKDLVFNTPSKGKELDLQGFLEWYALTTAQQKKQKGGIIRKKPLLLLTKFKNNV